MERARHQFFSRSVVAGDQDARGRSRNAFDLRDEFADDGGPADNFEPRLDVLTELRVLLREVKAPERIPQALRTARDRTTAGRRSASAGRTWELLQGLGRGRL